MEDNKTKKRTSVHDIGETNDDDNREAEIEKLVGVLTEEEQLRVLQKLIIENQKDIAAFSSFLKIPTVIVLFLNLIFAYKHVIQPVGPMAPIWPVLPFTQYEIRTESPIVATELSVIMTQFTIYLLSSHKWNAIQKVVFFVLEALCGFHALFCAKTGVIEMLWWMLPGLNMATTGLALWNMRRSSRDIEDLAKKTYHVKSA